MVGFCSSGSVVHGTGRSCAAGRTALVVGKGLSLADAVGLSNSTSGLGHERRLWLGSGESAVWSMADKKAGKLTFGRPLDGLVDLAGPQPDNYYYSTLRASDREVDPATPGQFRRWMAPDRRLRDSCLPLHT